MLNKLVEFLPLLITILTVITGFITWGLNEKSKRKQESYKRKEEHYVGLVKSINGFTTNSTNTSLKENFLEQVNLCWLYCPDNVILKLYEFLETLKEGAKSSEETRDKALGDVIIAIREDLLKDTKMATKLTNQQFKLYSAKMSSATLENTDR